MNGIKMFYSSYLQFSVVLIMISKIISQGKQELDNLQWVNNGLMYLEMLPFFYNSHSG